MIAQEKKLGTKRLVLATLVIAMSLVLAACGPGQMIGPTLIPTPSPTATPPPTLAPTFTPTTTSTSAPTITPTATPTIPCTEKGWSDIDGIMLDVSSNFKGTNAFLNQPNINTLDFLGINLSLQTDVSGISKIEVVPCTQEALSLIVKGLNAFIVYSKYISTGADNPGHILILPSDININTTKAFREEFKNDLIEANDKLLALKIKLDNLNYLANYINAVY